MSFYPGMLDAPTIVEPFPVFSREASIDRAVALAFFFSALFSKSTVTFSRMAANFSFRDSEPLGRQTKRLHGDSCLWHQHGFGNLAVKPVTFSDFSSECATWLLDKERILASWASWMTRWNLSLEAVGLALAALAQLPWQSHRQYLMSGILMLSCRSSC
jgi:hypothetical protein